jgi:hypothetical protein
MRHINNMFNILEMRIRKMLDGNSIIP